ncbi:hypothetical protein GWI33_001318 [Rhynchophorus ferrugineus]|nr:hypothetical protein GWI33_001318 [Rhynchophorus ferrugineus]
MNPRRRRRSDADRRVIHDDRPACLPPCENVRPIPGQKKNPKYCDTDLGEPCGRIALPIASIWPLTENKSRLTSLNKYRMGCEIIIGLARG